MIDGGFAIGDDDGFVATELEHFSHDELVNRGIFRNQYVEGTNVADRG